jgi:hypothetical protein
MGNWQKSIVICTAQAGVKRVTPGSRGYDNYYLLSISADAYGSIVSTSKFTCLSMIRITVPAGKERQPPRSALPAAAAGAPGRAGGTQNCGTHSSAQAPTVLLAFHFVKILHGDEVGGHKVLHNCEHGHRVAPPRVLPQGDKEVPTAGPD